MRTLLLADDSLSVASAVELAFANRDVKVVAVLSGDRAIAQLETAPPDVILADIGMAGLDGYAVAAYVTQTQRLRHIPVMLLASPFEPIDEERARATRCQGVLVKPFTPSQVVQVVNELLDGRPPSDPWPAQMPRVEWAAPLPAVPIATPVLSIASPAPPRRTTMLPPPAAPPDVPMSRSRPLPPEPLPMAAIAGMALPARPVPTKPVSISPTVQSFEAGLDELELRLLLSPGGTAQLDDEYAAPFAEDVKRLPPTGLVEVGRPDIAVGAPVWEVVVTPTNVEPPAPTDVVDAPAIDVAVSAPIVPPAAPPEPVAAVSLPSEAVVPTAPTTEVSAPAVYRLRMKIGNDEFEAEGPQAQVLHAFNEFKRLRRQPTTAARPAKGGKVKA